MVGTSVRVAVGSGGVVRVEVGACVGVGGIAIVVGDGTGADSDAVGGGGVLVPHAAINRTSVPSPATAIVCLIDFIRCSLQSSELLVVNTI